MPIAAFWGTTVGYTEYYEGRVTIETIDGRVAVVNKSAFEYLYFKLNEFTAALKEDCIEYAVNNIEKDILDYPEWYSDAYSDGVFYKGWGQYVFHDHKEEKQIQMSPNSMVLRNYKGELRYMEPYDFHKYYDTLRE